MAAKKEKQGIGARKIATARASGGKKVGAVTTEPSPRQAELGPLPFPVFEKSKVHVVYVWPDTKTSPKHLRAAQAAAGDFNQLAAIGVPLDVASERRKRDPTRTAVDDIRDAVQVGNPALLLEAVRVFPFANLVSNPGFVEILHALQTRARGGDPWAKKTLKAVGEKLGASGKGQTPQYAAHEIRQRRQHQNRQAQRQFKKTHSKQKNRP